MAFYPSKLILSLLFVVATAASAAHSIPVVGQLSLSIAGRVVCTVPGTNCTTCPGIAGVKVTLSCNGGRTILAQAITTRGGLVNLALSAPGVPLLGQLQQCLVYVKLPVAACNVFLRTGTLSSPLIFVNVVSRPAGLTANLTFELPTLVA